MSDGRKGRAPKKFLAHKDRIATAYILGVYLGDGGVSTKDGIHAAFQVTAVDIDFLEMIQEMLFRIFGERPEIKYHRKAANENSRDQYRIRLSSTPFCRWLVLQTGKKDHLPDFVTGRSAEIKRVFLQGLMDSEGCITRRKYDENGCIRRPSRIQFAVISEWIFDVKNMFQEIGIETSSIFRSGGCYRFIINPRKYSEGGMTFSIHRKAEILLDEIVPRERKRYTPNPNQRHTKPSKSKNVTTEAVLMIKRLYFSGASTREIVDQTGVNYWAVNRIVRNKTFAHINP